MHKTISILSITAHDPAGQTGILADAHTATQMGADIHAVCTAVAFTDKEGNDLIQCLPDITIANQLRKVQPYTSTQAIKIGMVNSVEAIRMLSREIIAIPNIVLSPGMLSSSGKKLSTDEVLQAWRKYLLPMAKIVILRCSEAELLLNTHISTDEDMRTAAKTICTMGAEAVMLRGARYKNDMLTALLYSEGNEEFFMSYNMKGWQRHGVGGTMSTAIAVRLAMGDDVSKAVSEAHRYMHSQVVYAMEPSEEDITVRGHRPADIYNRLLSLIAANYHKAHDVNFYADRLAITPRYLGDVTRKVVEKSPKEVISDYLMLKAKEVLTTTRMSIQEISIALGYSSQAIFCRFFSRNAGCSPNHYRYGHDTTEQEEK